jgi:DNA invertase Pin-like site-specific DNA recombinase
VTITFHEDPQGPPAPLTIPVKPKKHAERDEAIRQALAEGEPARAVADRFELTRDRVRKIAKVNGATPVIRKRGSRIDAWTPPSPERDAAIWRAVAEGGTLRAVGDRFGLCRERVRRIAAAPLTITAKKPGPRIGKHAERDEAIRRAIAEGEPPRAVADRFGLTRERVWQIATFYVASPAKKDGEVPPSRKNDVVIEVEGVHAAAK